MEKREISLKWFNMQKEREGEREREITNESMSKRKA